MTYVGHMDYDGLHLDVRFTLDNGPYGLRIQFITLTDPAGRQCGDPFTFADYMDAIATGNVVEVNDAP